MTNRLHAILISVILFGFLSSEIAESHDLFLWKSRKGDSDFYLLGSVHTMTKDVYPLDLQIESAFNSCDVLVLETVPDSLDPYELVPLVTYTDGTNLSNHVSEATYKKILAMSKDAGVPESYINQLKPWYAVMLLTVSELENSGIKAQYGIDMHFTRKAEGAEKELRQLETPVEQLRYLSVYEEASDAYIDYVVEETESSIEEIGGIIDAWKKGDEKTLTDILFEIEEEFPEIEKFNEKILYERNKNMAERIDKMLDIEGKYFIIVGTAHLIGNRSIIDLLQREGYEFERLQAVD